MILDVLSDAKSRKQRLRACENVLTEHGKQWVAVGLALTEIRDNDLYKEAGYTSWPKYLADHEAVFGIGSESSANRYIKAARVEPVLPKTRSSMGGFGWGVQHAIELDRLPTDAAAKKVATDLLKDGKPPKVSVVKKAVDRVLGIERKRPAPYVAPVPPAFNDVMSDYVSDLKYMANTLHSLSDTESKIFREAEPGLILHFTMQIERVQKELERIAKFKSLIERKSV